MSTVLTYDEIKERFPDKWLLIADAEMDDEMNILRGKVVAHSKDRDEVYRALLTVPGKRISIDYTGEPPAGWAVALTAKAV
ncbi:MAG TPA: hypothetical protein VFZ34_31655 [Blastocatellia bacterium]|nr:hypothetical protein [Blastocatellia bacterium]